jgi:hypothetical protein
MPCAWEMLTAVCLASALSMLSDLRHAEAAKLRAAVLNIANSVSDSMCSGEFKTLSMMRLALGPMSPLLSRDIPASRASSAGETLRQTWKDVDVNREGRCREQHQHQTANRTPDDTTTFWAHCKHARTHIHALDAHIHRLGDQINPRLFRPPIFKCRRDTRRRPRHITAHTSRPSVWRRTEDDCHTTETGSQPAEGPGSVLLRTAHERQRREEGQRGGARGL